MSKKRLIDAAKVERTFKKWMKNTDSLAEYNAIKACLELLDNTPEEHGDELKWTIGKEIKCDDKHFVLAEFLYNDGDYGIGFAEFYSEEDYRNNWNSEHCYKEFDRVGWYVPNPSCGAPMYNITKWMLIPEPDDEGELQNE